ncbi:MAG: Crp/Fnr family transcriptional regulator [Ruminococcus sp.]|nr:Crp/Fnr family transcriptional regulator [Ruminococcus sp.]
MDINLIIDTMISAAKNYGIELNKDDLNELMRISTLKLFHKGDIIRQIGDENDTIGFVLSGLIRSYYLDENGNETTRYFHPENSLFMDEGLVNYHKSICACEALEDCVVIIFPTKEVKEIALKLESLRNLYITLLENSVKYKIERENLFLTCSATERYLQFVKTYPMLCDRVRQSYIATYLGIAPESLSRIRRSLKN